jgi:DNA-binding NtrC family response regulator
MVKRVMIVDDEEDIRNSVKQILERDGYYIEMAVNGDDCLKKIGKFKPDLILMDIMMPGTPVKKVVKKIKGKVAYVSVVRMTEAEKENLIGKNIVGFIQKPFDIGQLSQKVGDVLHG